MRRFIIVICLLSINKIEATAQSSSRFPLDSQAIWRISNISYSPLDNTEIIHDKYEYFIDSDTIINSQSYFKLYRSGVAYYDTPFYYENVYSGAIRDDSNRIYYVEKDESSETLLFDYNLKLGDTIHSKIGKDHIINKIDTMQDGRIRLLSIPDIYAGCTPIITLIEGIGHASGITEPPSCEHIGYYGHYLNCYQENNELIYENDMSLVDCSDFFSEIYSATIQRNYYIYPNPAHDFLYIEMADNKEKFKSITIINFLSQKTMYNKNYYNQIGNKIEMNISKYPKGFYIIKTETESNIYVNKILIE